MAEKLITMSTTLFVTILMTRYLSTSEWGLLSYLVALVSIISPLSSLGLNSLISKALLDKIHNHSAIMGTAISLRFIGAAFGAALLMFISSLFFLDSHYELKLLLWLSIGSIFSSFVGVVFYFEAFMISKYIAIARTSAILLLSLIKIYAVYSHKTFEFIVFCFSLDFVLQALFILIIYQIKVKDIQCWSFESDIAKDLLSKSYWLVLSSLCAILYLKVDQVMIGKLVSVEEVGQYAIAARFSEVWFFLPQVIVASLYPILNNLRNKELFTYKLRLQQACDFLFIIAISVAILIQFTSDWFIANVFGSDYSIASEILKVHVWCGIFVFMRALASKWLIIENLLRYSLLTQGIGALVNICCNFILIPMYGGIGAAYATIISYAAASWIAFFISSNTRQMAFIMFRSLILPTRFLVYVGTFFKH